MTLGHLLAATWSWDPSVIVGCLALLGVYFVVGRRRITVSQALFFSGGVLVMFLALESSLDELGDTYLFSAHMLQHLLLILLVPRCCFWACLAGWPSGYWPGRWPTGSNRF